MAKIGVVIPTLNNLEYTKKCVASIERFGLSEEIVFIILDNGSTDGTLEWLKEWKSPFQKIISLSKENRLVNKSWEEGRVMAKDAGCDFVAFINNDIEVGSDWSKLVQEIFDQLPEVWCICPAFTRLEKPEGWEEEAKRRYVLRTTIKTPILKLGAAGFFFVVKMSAFEELAKLDGVLGFPEEYNNGLWYEDRDFWLRLEKVGHPPVMLWSFLIHHYESRTLSKLTTDEFNKLKDNNARAFQKRWGFGPNLKK